MKNKPFVIIDAETAGSNPLRDRTIETASSFPGAFQASREKEAA
jgi:hypothetical protein